VTSGIQNFPAHLPQTHPEQRFLLGMLLLNFIYFLGGLFYVAVSIQTVQHQTVG
jgi:hypothetical protein